MIRRNTMPALGTINVVFGAHDLDMPLAGLTVEEIQFSVRGLLNVSMDAEAYLDGIVIEDKTITVFVGQRLEFMRPFGRKGIGNTYTKQEFMQAFHMTEADWSDWVTKGLPIDTMKNGIVVLNETKWTSGKKVSEATIRRSM